MHKQLFLDLETTGTRLHLHGIHQLAGEIVLDGKTVETFDLHPRPFDDDTLDYRALEMAGLTEEELWSRELTPVVAREKLTKLFEKHVDRFDPKDKFELVGYNVNFDDEFTRKWWKKTGDDFYGAWVYFPPKDVAQMVARVLGPDRGGLKSFKLENVIEYFGIETPEGKYHNAVFDIRATKLLHDLLEERFRVLPPVRSNMGNIGDAIRHYRYDYMDSPWDAATLADWLHENSGGFLSEEECEVLAKIETR